MTRLARACLVAACLFFALPVPVASTMGAEESARCDDVYARLTTIDAGADDAWARYEEAMRGLPEDAAPLLEHARQRAGSEGSVAAAVAWWMSALEDGCGIIELRAMSTREEAARARDEVLALLRDDARFTGARAQPDFFDELLFELGRWLEEVLQSEGMRRYAESSRFLFLSLLGLAIVAIALRLWRARARERRQAEVQADGVRIERARARAFREWREQAERKLAAGELRGALRAGHMALLARLGEVEPTSVTPARTNREILGRLDEKRRSSVAPPLERFDRAFFGGEAEAGAVEGFLREVDGAAQALREEQP